jgi:hypothetical protein
MSAEKKEKKRTDNMKLCDKNTDKCECGSLTKGNDKFEVVPAANSEYHWN